MRLIGLACFSLILAGCNYSPEEQYRKCMGGFAKEVWQAGDTATSLYKLSNYDALCRFSAGMDTRMDTLTPGGLGTAIADDRALADLLQEFGYAE